ncbi:poly(U)-specific endoribonuclease homolog [Nasonia vitripennis]|uniref:EndoU domain-containing protein n=1 Tax=Nasonia vitripennis TaxID=7425 RepID=A0A7M7LJB7_NASVI|nr:poly(U)-specific endoribonuclease homolog [Nasonia vitripennis]
MFVINGALYCLIFLTVFSSIKGHNHHHNHHNTRHHTTEQKSLISTKELRRVSEELFEKLPTGIYQYLNVNYQGQRDSKDAKDEAAEPLLLLPKDLFDMVPTIRLMQKLYDNYDMNTLHAEDVTLEEDEEENDFIDSLLNTSIMMHSMDFLSSKGFFQKNINEYRQILKKIWFHQYSRSNRTELGSSGFEHVFLVEKKGGSHITGLHNWIFFATEEYENKANYLGYISKLELANKAAVIKFYLSYMDKIKLSSMFLGTPPEFEMALYTLCFFARPNKGCNVLLGNEKITIQTWVQYSNNEALIGSSFPKIYN